MTSDDDFKRPDHSERIAELEFEKLDAEARTMLRKLTSADARYFLDLWSKPEQQGLGSFSDWSHRRAALRQMIGDLKLSKGE
jgi:hypothetical protein